MAPILFVNYVLIINFSSEQVKFYFQKMDHYILFNKSIE